MRQGEFWSNTGYCGVHSAKILKYLSTLWLRSVAAQQWGLVCKPSGVMGSPWSPAGCCRSPLFPQPQSPGPNQPPWDNVPSPKKPLLLRGSSIAKWLLIPPPAPAHHAQGIMELSMDRILLWVTLKAEGNKKEILPLPVSEWFPNLSVHQVCEKKAKNPFSFRKFEHLTTLSSLMNHLLNLTQIKRKVWSVQLVKFHLATLW